MENQIIKSRTLPIAAAFVTVAALLWAASHYLAVAIPAGVLTASRWLAIAGLALWSKERRSLTAWILFSMIVGAEIGHDWPVAAQNARTLSLIFLSLIKTLIAPLISTLVVGIAGHSNLKQVGRMGVKALIYFRNRHNDRPFYRVGGNQYQQGWCWRERGGAGIYKRSPQAAAQADGERNHSAHLSGKHCQVAEGQVLQIVVFSVLFGIAVALLNEKQRRPMLSFMESLAETMFKFTNIVMMFAPIGVGAAIAYTVGHMGLGVLLDLFKLLATLYTALVVFVTCVLLPVALIARVPVRRFIQAVAEPVSIAFATTSSEAALPLAMDRMEQLGVPRQIVAFVMPTGYSFNLDGSTLYLSLASVFVAQAAGIHM